MKRDTCIISIHIAVSACDFFTLCVLFAFHIRTIILDKIQKVLANIFVAYNCGRIIINRFEFCLFARLFYAAYQ